MMKNYNDLDVGKRPGAMKRKSKCIQLLALLFFATMAQMSIAQTTVTIPSANTNTGSTRFPLTTWFGYERSSMIYTAAEVGASGTITAVRFYLNSQSGGGNATNVKIYMKTRATTAHTSGTYNSEISGATLVYGPTTITAASLTAAAWNTITLATPFGYTTGSNLQVIVETNAVPAGNDGSLNAKQFRYSTSQTGGFESWSQDTTDPGGTLAGSVGNTRPNIQLVVAAPTAPSCASGFSPASAATNIARNPTLSWSAANGATSYDVYFGTSSTAPTFIGNQTGLTYTPALLSASTQYYWQIVPRNAVGAATGCAIQSFTTGTSIVYCTAGATNTSTSFEKIARVVFNTIDNSSTSFAGYESFTNISTTVAPSSSYNFTITPNGNSYSGDQLLIWIDYNQDGDFLDAGENVFTSATSAGPYTGSFTIPSGASLGNTLMRIRLHDASNTPNATSCGTSLYGQVEDYTLNIANIPPPTITSLGTSSGCVGGTITINGTNLLGAGTTAANVKIGGTAVTSVTSNNGSTIVAVIGSGTTGTVTVTTPQGTGTGPSFTVNPLPTASASSNSPICAGGTLNLTGTTNGTGFSWTGPNGFTSSSQNPSINNATTLASGVYTFTATSSAGCTFSGTTTVSVNPTPSGLSVTPASATICASTVQSLTATGAASFTLNGGNASANSTTTNYPSPFSVYYGGTKHQFIILASELTAAGFTAGSSLSSIAFNVQAVGTSPLAQQNFKLRIGATNASTMTTTFISTPSTLVYGPVTRPAPSTGFNTINFTTNFVWDGTSNIFVEETFSNNIGGVAANGVSNYVHSPGATRTAVYYADSVSAATVEAATTATSTFTTRPDFRLATGSPTVTWSPTTNLYSDAAATIAYTGTNLRTVYAKPSADVTYTATATLGTCSSTATSVLTVTPVSVAGTISGAMTVCAGTNSTTLTLSGNTGTIQWQSSSDNVSFSDLAGQTGSTYTATNLNATTYYRVVVTNGICSSATSASVTMTVNPNVTYYADADGDTYGDINAPVVSCMGAPTVSGHLAVLNSTDCNDADGSVYQSTTLFIDVDGDGYDNGTSVQCYGASVPVGYSATTNGSDCNDNDNTKHATFNFYADADNDTYGAGSLTAVCAVNGTTPPAGYSLNGTDCNDNDASVYQSATLYIDADGDGYDNGTSVQCYGASIPSGYSATTLGADCNDNNASVYQSATLFVDADGDGYDNGTSVQCYGASIPAGYSATTLGADCNDNNALVYQSATLFVDADADGYDNGTSVQCYGASVPAGYSATTLGSDCNDADATTHQTYPFYVDADGDSFGAGSLVQACAVNGTTAPTGYSLNNTDCNDSNASVYQSETLFVDADGDGYDNGTSVQCYGSSVPSGYSATTLGSDCNDADATTHQTYPFYVDADGDSFGAGSLVQACAVNGTTAPAGYSLNNTDCNDSNATVYQSGLLFTDVDGDHYTVGSAQSVCYGATVPNGYSVNSLGTDCNDNDATVYRTGTFYVDADGDNYTTGVTAVVCYGAATPAGYIVSNTAVDCNDAVAAINPGHAEVLYNGVDDNCDGNLDEGFQIKTRLLAEYCDGTTASINSLIGITTVSSAITGYRIKVTNGTQVQIIEKNVPHFTLTELPSYAYATTYSIQIELQRYGVWLGYYGDVCHVSSPPVLTQGGAGQVSPSQCGTAETPFTLPRINALVATTSLPGVTAYRFRITNLTNGAGPNVVQVITRSQNWFSLQMLTQYNYATTYQVEVAIQTTTPGVFSGYGGACYIASPAAPSLEPCGGTIASSTTRVAATSLNGVTQYRFQIQKDEDGSTVTLDRGYNWFTFGMVPGYTPGVIYNVRVAVMTTGAWSPFGDACQITSPPAVTRHIAEAQSNESTIFAAAAYPNPFANDFKVNVTTTSNEKVTIAVYDMAGRLIETRQSNASDVNASEVGARYAAGVYNVIVSQGSNVQTLRVVKR